MRIHAFFYKLQLFLKRVICYEKPLRVALVKYISAKYKTFRPHYESIVYEACIEANKLGISDISVLELGVAGGNGIIALEKYKNKIQRVLGVNIHIYGFDLGVGLPETNIPEDLPYIWKNGQYAADKELQKSRIESKIFFGDVRDTIDEFIKISPDKIGCIFVDLDYYTSTIAFLSQIPKLEKFLLPRVLFYFDDLYSHWNYMGQFNGELKAINEFNSDHLNYKLSCSIDHINDHKFPLAKGSLFTLHSFDNNLYCRYIGKDSDTSLSIGSREITSLFE